MLDVGGGQLVWWNAGREEYVMLEALEHDALTSSGAY
jgi:hypothetical protein